MCMDDDMIVEAMASSEESKHYQRYVSDRFVVKDIEELDDGLVAIIHDSELDEEFGLYSGDALADGSVEVMAAGVLFLPPRADVRKFMLPHSAEISPMFSHSYSKYRTEMNDMLRQEDLSHEHSDADGAIIIMLGGEKSMY